MSSGKRCFWTILLRVTLEVGTKPAARFNFRVSKGFLITQSVKIWNALLCRAVYSKRGWRDCMTTLPGRFWKGSSLKVGLRTVIGETETLMKSKINFFCLWDSITLDIWAGGDGLGERWLVEKEYSLFWSYKDIMKEASCSVTVSVSLAVVTHCDNWQIP